jgi:hypothetical protein
VRVLQRCAVEAFIGRHGWIPFSVLCAAGEEMERGKGASGDSRREKKTSARYGTKCAIGALLIDKCNPMAYKQLLLRNTSVSLGVVNLFNAGSYLITIAELENFVDDAEKIFSRNEYEQLILFLATHPDAGEIMPKTGGIRKVRWAAKGQGKRGGARVIYYFRDLNIPVYLLAVYAKGEKINLTEAEKKMMSRMVDEIVEAAVAKRSKIITRA